MIKPSIVWNCRGLPEVMRDLYKAIGDIEGVESMSRNERLNLLAEVANWKRAVYSRDGTILRYIDTFPPSKIVTLSKHYKDWHND